MRLYDQRKRSAWPTVLWVALVVAVGVGFFFVANGWLQDALNPPSTVTDTSVHSIENEGRDELEVTPEKKDDYRVEATAPRMLSIDTLNIQARILPMGLNSNGAIQAPLNIYDAGWYTASARPGTAGAGFIDAHASGPTRQGLFAYLDTLKKGDTVTVEKGDGETISYRVVHVETVALADVDMKKALAPYEGVTNGLNLMTCAGAWLKDQKTYDQRAIVYTEQIES